MKPVPRSALKNPIDWLNRLMQETTTAKTKIEINPDIVQSLNRLSAGLDKLVVSRNRINRKIGSAKSEGNDATQYIEETKILTSDIKLQENKLLHFLQKTADDLRDHRSSKNAEASGPESRKKPAYFEASDSVNIVDKQFLIDVTCSLVENNADKYLYTEYVSTHKSSTAYHQLELGSLISAITGQKCNYLLAKTSEGKICGVLPTITLSSSIFGTYMVSMPWFNYGGPLADNTSISDKLMRAASDIAKRTNCSHAEFRETVARPNWQAQTHKASMISKLPNSRDALEQSLNSSIRAQSNKALRAGCEVHFGREELLDDFYKVFSIKMRSLGTPIHHKYFFLSLLELFAETSSICIVKLNSQPVAVGFLIDHGTTQEIPWASSLRKFDSLGVNMLLYRSILGRAAEAGYEFFDFGRSTIDGPTFRFKKQWGAQPQTLYWHSWNAGGGVLELSPTSPKYRLAIAVWKRLPVWLTVFLGPRLIKSLP